LVQPYFEYCDTDLPQIIPTVLYISAYIKVQSRMTNLFRVYTVLMIITGAFVNGPYAMITTAVSADLVSSLYAVIATTTTTVL